MRKSQFMRGIIFIFSFVVLGLASCTNNSANNNPAASNNNNAVNAAANKTRTQGTVPVYGYEVVNTDPHDSKAFTQGLIFHDGWLYESTGEFGDSAPRRVDLKTGKGEQNFDLAREIFGEGLTIFNA